MINTSDEAEDLAGRLPCLREFAAAGQDKAAVARLYNALIEDLQPANLVERILIRDIAVLTIRSEELRMVQLAVHKVVMGRTAGAARAVPGGDQSGASPAGMGEASSEHPLADGATQPGVTRAGDELIDRAVGVTYAENLSMINLLAQMEADVRRDRNRILEFYGDRRRQKVQEMADALVGAVTGGS